MARADSGVSWRGLNVCTLITADRLAHARVLAASLAKHEPRARLTVMLVDRPEDGYEPAGEDFDVLALEDLGIPGVWDMAVRYDAFEFSMALKPWLLRHILGDAGHVLYLDADTRVYGPLWDEAVPDGGKRIALTPHLLAPLPDDGLAPSHQQILMCGTFNAGCIGLAAGEETERFLDWWAERLRRGSRVDPASGRFVDQRWLDLVPAMLGDGVRIIRHPGVNVAYWNLPSRALELSPEGRPTVDGEPLLLFHFSGFDPDVPARLSGHDQRYVALSAGDPVAGLCASYAGELDAAGHAEARTHPYSWGRTAGGLELTAELRELLDPPESIRPAPTPFEEAQEPRWRAWWNEPEGRHGITRFLHTLHDRRPELQTAFPRLDSAGAAEYRRWAATVGRPGIGIPVWLLPPRPVRAAGSPAGWALATIATNRSLARARVLARSFREHHSDVPVHLLLADRIDAASDPSAEPFELIALDEMVGSAGTFLPFRLGERALVAALRPFLLERLLDQGCERALLIDPETMVLGALNETALGLAGHSALLTPRLLSRTQADHERGILEAGIYDPGVIGLRDGEAGRELLRWWQDRATVWDEVMELAPTLFEDIALNRDPRVGIAHWNIGERVAHLRDCRLFRFSGFDPERPDQVTGGNPRLLVADLDPGAVRIFERYADALWREGHAERSALPDAFAAFDDGVQIPAVAREIHAELGDDALPFGDPFRSGDGSFRRWLETPEDPSGPTPLWRAVYERRPDVRDAFPDPEGRDRAAFAEWVNEHGAVEHRVAPELAQAFGA